MKTLTVKHGMAYEQTRVEVNRTNGRRVYFPTWESQGRVDELVNKYPHKVTVSATVVSVTIAK